MRILVLKDKKITLKEYEKLTYQFENFMLDNGVGFPLFFLEEEDYSNVPTEADNDGDLKPTRAYTQALMDNVHKKYGNWGVDHVVILVHRDNWVFTGIWGTNWSNIFHTYHVHLCRFDHKNMANSLGTLYHEWMHSLDALIKVHVGLDVSTLFNGLPYDKFIVHGGRPDKEGTTEWKYIKWKENTTALRILAPWLDKAYRKRKELYYQPYLNALHSAVAFLRSLLNKKNGVSPSITK